MNSNTAHLSAAARLATLLGTASLLAMADAAPVSAQAQVAAPADEVPEIVLITGSLIRGTSAVGAPVTNFTPQDFATTGALTTADLFRTFPAATVSPGPLATNAGNQIERGTRVSLRGLDSGFAVRSLLMIDGMRFPAQGNGQCIVDPSIIPALSMDHIDVLVDGASATYGSDAISGVINIILKRNMDGAITQARWTTGEGGKNRYLASAVWGRTWDGGQITLSYEWYNETPIMGNHPSKFGQDHTPWGFDDRRPLGSSIPATLSDGYTGSAGGRSQCRHVGAIGPRLHQLLCGPAWHRRELGTRRQRHRPHCAVQRLDLELVEFQHARQLGHQWCQEPVRSLRHRLVRRAPRSAMAATSPSISG